MRKIDHSTKKRCLITGKMIATMVSDSVITPKALPPEVKERRIAEVAQDLADIRSWWAMATPAQRAGAGGVKRSAQYRRAAHEFLTLTGTQPPAIYADM